MATAVPAESWGTQQGATIAGQEFVETPHFAASWLEEFTTS